MSKIDLITSMDDLDRLLDEAERTCSGSAPSTNKHVEFLSKDDEDTLDDDVSRWTFYHVFLVISQDLGGVQLFINTIFPREPHA